MRTHQSGRKLPHQGVAPSGERLSKRERRAELGLLQLERDLLLRVFRLLQDMTSLQGYSSCRNSSPDVWKNRVASEPPQFRAAHDRSPKHSPRDRNGQREEHITVLSS